jgi:hypothetical protein
MRNYFHALGILVTTARFVVSPRAKGNILITTITPFNCKAKTSLTLAKAVKKKNQNMLLISMKQLNYRVYGLGYAIIAVIRVTARTYRIQTQLFITVFGRFQEMSLQPREQLCMVHE